MNIHFGRQLAIYFAASFLVLAFVGCANARPASQPAPPTRPEPLPTQPATLTPSPTQSRTPITIPDTPADTSDQAETIEPTHAAIMTRRAPTYQAYNTSLPLTLEAQSTLRVQFPGVCEHTNRAWLSPDGNWLTNDCVDEFRVLSRDGHKQIILPHAKLSTPDTPIEYVYALYWSKDSQYLYFSTGFCCAEEASAYGSFGPLYRLELQSSARITMTDGYFNYYDFSPTGRHLLHIPKYQAGAGKPVRFHLIDLKSGAEQWFSLPGFEQATVDAWSQDGKRFAMTAQIGNTYEDNEQFAEFVVSLDDLSITQIIPLSDPDAFEVRWFDWADANITSVEVCPAPGAPCEKQGFYDPK